MACSKTDLAKPSKVRANSTEAMSSFSSCRRTSLLSFSSSIRASATRSPLSMSRVSGRTTISSAVSCRASSSRSASKDSCRDCAVVVPATSLIARRTSSCCSRSWSTRSPRARLVSISIFFAMPSAYPDPRREHRAGVTGGGVGGMKLKLDLHDIYNRGDEIERALRAVIDEAIAKKAPLVEIIPGKGSGQLKKRVLRFLDRKDIKALYHRVEKDSDNFGRVFVHFRWK